MRSALSSLARGLGIEPGEGAVCSWGALTVFLMGWAAVSLTNVSETLFLKRVGVDFLPLVFLANSLLLFGSSFAFGRIAARTEPRALLARTCFALAASLVPLWLLVRAEVRSVSVLLVIAAKQVDSIALIAFWVAMGGLLHGRQAKRLYAPIMAGGTLGAMIGSFASADIGRAAGIPALLLVAAGALALAGIMAEQLRRSRRIRLRRVTARTRAIPPPEPPASPRPLWRESRLFRMLVASALLSGLLAPMLYFQFSYVADLATRGANGEQRLLDLYAAFRGWLSAALLAIQVAGTARLFRRMGVPLASVLSPLVYFFGFLGLGVRLDLPAGIGAVAGANLQDHAIYEPGQRMLVTLFPEQVRASAMAWIEGPVRRAGGALGNVLILLALALGVRAWIGLVGLPIAAVWLAVTIVLWRVYPTLLLEMASDRRPKPGRGAPLPELVDPRTLRALMRSLVGADLQRCRAACDLVLEAPRERAATTLARALSSAPGANRPLLVETLHRLLDRGADSGRPVPAAARDLEGLFAGRGTPVERARLIDAYACLVADLRPDSHGARVLTPLVADPDEPVRLAAAVRLHDGAGAREAADATGAVMLATAFASDDGEVHTVALDELRAALLARGGDGVRWESLLALLVERLDDPRDRAGAAAALADVAARHGDRVAAVGSHLLAHAADPDPQVRSAVLRFVGYARVRTRAAWVVAHLAAEHPLEAAAAREAVRALGSGAMDALLAALHSGRRATRAAVLPLLLEMPVDKASLRALIEREVGAIRRNLAQLYGLRTGPVSDLVLQRLGERVDENVLTTLLLLATLHHEERLAALGRLLVRSPSGPGRAVLLEAIEALLPPGEKARLLPLIEGSGSAAGALGREPPSFEEALRAALTDHDALTLTFLVATLDAGTLARVGSTPEIARRHAAAHPATARTLASADDLENDAPDDGAPGERRMLNRVEILLHLRSLDLLGALTTAQLSELAHVVREERHPPGTTLVREGEFGDCMYLIDAGEVEITREGLHVGHLGPRQYFGEMSLFDGEHRAASVTATTHVRLLCLKRHDLLQVIEDHPGIAVAICQTLSRRVRELIEQLKSAT